MEFVKWLNPALKF